jgi:hypothetical protein
MARPSSCTSPHSADKRRSNGIGAKEAGLNARGSGQAIRAPCAQSGSCALGNRRIGGAEAWRRMSTIADNLAWPALLRKLDRIDPSFRN